MGLTCTRNDDARWSIRAKASLCLHFFSWFRKSTNHIWDNSKQDKAYFLCTDTLSQKKWLFSCFFKDHSLPFSQNGCSLLWVIQIFANEFLIFCLDLHLQIKIIGLLGTIDAFSNLMPRIHIFDLILRIFFLFIKIKGFFKVSDFRL